MMEIFQMGTKEDVVYKTSLMLAQHIRECDESTRGVLSRIVLCCYPPKKIRILTSNCMADRINRWHNFHARMLASAGF